MSILSRVSPTGFLVESGSAISRVSPSGFEIETLVQGSVAAAAGAGAAVALGGGLAAAAGAGAALSLAGSLAVSNTVAVNIGNTTVFGNNDSGDAGYNIAGPKITLTTALQIGSVALYVDTAVGNLRLGIYDATGAGGLPGTLKAQSASTAAVTGWNTLSMVTPVVLPPGDYFLAWQLSSGSLVVRKTAGSNASYYYSLAYGAFPSTFDTSGPTSDTTQWSIYGVFFPLAGDAEGLSGSPGTVSGAGAALAVTAGSIAATVGTGTALGVKATQPTRVVRADLLIPAATPVGAAAGSATLDGGSGSLPQAVGASVALAVSSSISSNPGIGAVSGSAAAAALSGSLASAAGAGAVASFTYDGEFFLSGSLGAIASAATVAAIGSQGQIAQAMGAGVAAAIYVMADGVAAAAGTASVAAVGSGEVAYNGVTQGDATVVSLSGSLVMAAGTVDVEGIFAVGNIGQVYGAATVLGEPPPAAYGTGDVSCAALSGSLAEDAGTCDVEGINYGNIGEALGDSSAAAIAVPNVPVLPPENRGFRFWSLEETGPHRPRKKKRKPTVPELRREREDTLKQLLEAAKYQRSVTTPLQIVEMEKELADIKRKQRNEALAKWLIEQD